MEVVLATTDADLKDLYRLRHRIYVEEMGIVPVDHPFVKPGALVDPFDAWSIQLMLKVDGVPAGTVRVTRASDGPLEIDEYVDATGTLDDPSQAAEITRLMVLR